MEVIGSFEKVIDVLGIKNENVSECMSENVDVYIVFFGF